MIVNVSQIDTSPFPKQYAHCSATATHVLDLYSTVTFWLALHKKRMNESPVLDLSNGPLQTSSLYGLFTLYPISPHFLLCGCDNYYNH